MCVPALTRLLFLQFSVVMAPVHAACALLSLAPLLVLGVPPIWTQPEQVHLSYPGKCLNCLQRPHVFFIQGYSFPRRITNCYQGHMDRRFTDVLYKSLKSSGVFRKLNFFCYCSLSVVSIWSEVRVFHVTPRWNFKVYSLQHRHVLLKCPGAL